MINSNVAISDKAATLVMVKGSGAGQRYDLGTEATIGRSSFCDIVISSNSVSREHCRIRLRESGFWIEDLNSVNGTYVNGLEVRRPIQLGHKDRIHVFDVTFLYVENDNKDPSFSGIGDATVVAVPVKPTEPRGPQVVNTMDATSESRIGQNSQEKWRASLMMMRHLGLSLDVDEILARTLDDLFQIFSQTDRGYLMLLGSDGKLSMQAMKMDGGTNVQNSVGPVDQTLANRVLENTEAVLCRDEDDESDCVLDVPIRTMICAPLMSPLGRALGVIYLDTKSESDPFTDDDVELLASISSVAGQSVEFAREHERRISDQEKDNRRLQKEVEERKRIEADLRRSNEEMQQFAYVSSHDLQEPLRAVVGFTELLREECGGSLGETADKYIQHSVEGARRMQSLIDGLLQFSRVETRGKPFAPVDCNKVLDETLANLATEIKQTGAKIVNHGLPSVTGDQSQLVRLFENLIDNSLKFRGEQPLQIEVQAAERDADFVLSVHDNGVGFDAKHAERVFVIFQRLHTRDKYPGTGIGLAMARKIVHRHNGRIWVESELGEGSTFYFSIPKDC